MHHAVKVHDCGFVGTETTVAALIAAILYANPELYYLLALTTIPKQHETHTAVRATFQTASTCYTGHVGLSQPHEKIWYSDECCIERELTFNFAENYASKISHHSCLFSPTPKKK